MHATHDLFSQLEREAQSPPLVHSLIHLSTNDHA
jgi:hypothetical protein